MKLPALVAEQLALDEVGRDGAAVDGQERLPCGGGSARGSSPRPAPCRCRSRRAASRWRRSARPSRSGRRPSAWAARRRSAGRSVRACAARRAGCRSAPSARGCARRWRGRPSPAPCPPASPGSRRRPCRSASTAVSTLAWPVMRMTSVGGLVSRSLKSSRPLPSGRWRSTRTTSGGALSISAAGLLQAVRGPGAEALPAHDLRQAQDEVDVVVDQKCMRHRGSRSLDRCAVRFSAGRR